MKILNFASSIILAGALFVSVGVQAQESPYRLWESQDDNTVEDSVKPDTSAPEVTVTSPNDVQEDGSPSDLQSSGGLFGGSRIVNVESGTMYSYAPKAIEGWVGRSVDPDLHSTPKAEGQEEEFTTGRSGVDAAFGAIAEGDVTAVELYLVDFYTSLPPQNQEQDDARSGLGPIPFQFRRRSEDQPEPTPKLAPSWDPQGDVPLRPEQPEGPLTEYIREPFGSLIRDQDPGQSNFRPDYYIHVSDAAQNYTGNLAD